MGARWIVLRQEQVIGKLPDNSYGPVVRVTYRTANNVVRWIDVPVEDYTADNVSALIEAQVDEIDAVTNL